METSRFNPSRILLTLLLAAVSLNTGYASESEQRTPSTITNVTVFLNHAQVTRLAKVNLQPGITQLIFDRVSPFININSIQVKTENNITLLSVAQRNNFLKNEEKPRFILELEDTLAKVTQQMELLRIKREGLLLEKDLLISNKQIGGENSGVKIEDLEDALTLFRKRSIEIGEELLKQSASEKRLAILRQKLQAQLDEFLRNQNSAIEIVVTVKCLTAVSNARIEWSYLVSHAAWVPFYDIRVKDTKSPLQLVSKAYITQSTGEEWKNVTLKLSTGNPNESGTKPELSPLYLSFRRPVYGYAEPAYMERKDKNAARQQNAPAAEDGLAFSDGQATTTQTAVNIEFNVLSAHTIPSDNNPHQVDLSVNQLDAEYAYGAVPKLDKDAFVTARLSGNDLVNQISGEAHIYFDGTFTGKTYITGTTSDTMLVSLGRDKRIQIQRVMLKEFCSKSFVGGNRKEISSWELVVRNTRKEPIVIVLEDQFPVTTDKEIEVKLLHTSGAFVDETTGKLKWQLTLNAEQTQSVKFSYEVKYPKEKIISPH